MPSPFIIDNWTTDQNGNVIGQTIGEQLFDTGGLNCQDLFWSGQLWLGDPNDVYLQQRATQIAQDGGNEKFIFGSYGLSAVAGAGGWGTVAGYDAVGGSVGLQVFGTRVMMGASMELNGMPPPPLTDILGQIGYWSAWFFEP